VMALSRLLRRLLYKQEVGRSSPALPTIYSVKNLAEGCYPPHGRNPKSQSYDRELLAENHHSWWKWATASRLAASARSYSSL
jgi:hypothetical protein